MMRQIILSLTIASLVTAPISGLASTVYKTVLADGTVLFSDIPRPGSEVVDLKKLPQNTAVGFKPAAPPPSANRPKRPQAARPEKQYQLLITSPAADSTIRNNAGNIKVTAQLSPSAGGTFSLWLDGVEIAQQNTPDFALQNIDRGEHKLKITFAQQSGKVIASSPEQTFVLLRASLLNRPN